MKVSGTCSMHSALCPCADRTRRIHHKSVAREAQTLLDLVECREAYIQSTWQRPVDQQLHRRRANPHLLLPVYKRYPARLYCRRCALRRHVERSVEPGGYNTASGERYTAPRPARCALHADPFYPHPPVYAAHVRRSRQLRFTPTAARYRDASFGSGRRLHPRLSVDVARRPRMPQAAQIASANHQQYSAQNTFTKPPVWPDCGVWKAGFCGPSEETLSSPRRPASHLQYAVRGWQCEGRRRRELDSPVSTRL